MLIGSRHHGSNWTNFQSNRTYSHQQQSATALLIHYPSIGQNLRGRMVRDYSRKERRSRLQARLQLYRQVNWVEKLSALRIAAQGAGPRIEVPINIIVPMARQIAVLVATRASVTDKDLHHQAALALYGVTVGICAEVTIKTMRYRG